MRFWVLYISQNEFNGLLNILLTLTICNFYISIYKNLTSIGTPSIVTHNIIIYKQLIFSTHLFKFKSNFEYAKFSYRIKKRVPGVRSKFIPLGVLLKCPKKVPGVSQKSVYSPKIENR